MSNSVSKKTLDTNYLSKATLWQYKFSWTQSSQGSRTNSPNQSWSRTLNRAFTWRKSLYWMRRRSNGKGTWHWCWNSKGMWRNWSWLRRKRRQTMSWITSTRLSWCLLESVWLGCMMSSEERLFSVCLKVLTWGSRVMNSSMGINWLYKISGYKMSWNTTCASRQSSNHTKQTKPTFSSNSFWTETPKTPNSSAVLA